MKTLKNGPHQNISKKRKGKIVFIKVSIGDRPSCGKRHMCTQVCACTHTHTHTHTHERKREKLCTPANPLLANSTTMMQSNRLITKIQQVVTKTHHGPGPGPGKAQVTTSGLQLQITE